MGRKGALGSSVCALVLVYGAATSRKYGEIKELELLLAPFPAYECYRKNFAPLYQRSEKSLGNTPALHKQCPDVQYSEQHLLG